MKRKVSKERFKMDELICSDKEEAKKYIDSIGGKFIEVWEFLDDGKVKLILLDGWKDNGKE